MLSSSKIDEVSQNSFVFKLVVFKRQLQLQLQLQPRYITQHYATLITLHYNYN